MARFVLLMALTLTSLVVAAAQPFWVVGSFERVDLAREAAADYAARTGEKIIVSRHQLQGQTRYRLMVAQNDAPDSQLDELNRLGISAWPLSTDTVDEVEEVTPADAADRQYYLVLGAWFDAARARAMADKWGGTVLAAESGNMTRVVKGPFEGRNPDELRRAREDGITDAWWLTVTGETRAEPDTMTTDSDVEERAEPAMAASDAPEPAPADADEAASAPADTERVATAPQDTAPPAIRPPEADESFFDYCVGRANSQERALFCTNSNFIASKKDKQRGDAGLQNEVLARWCASEATRAQRREFCGER